MGRPLNRCEALTTYDKSHRLAGEGILGGEVTGRHLALPQSVVEVQRGGADPQGAVAAKLHRRRVEVQMQDVPIVAAWDT